MMAVQSKKRWVKAAGIDVKAPCGCLNHQGGEITFCKVHASVYQLTQDRAELLACLRAFAQLDIAHMQDKPNTHPVFGLNNTVLLLGDIRQARLLVARLEKGA